MTNQVYVRVNEGLLKGTICDNNTNNTKYFSFKGIPYGKPPIGPLRFKAPQAVEPWIGELDATQESKPCYALDFETRKTNGSEDCLYLNIFTNELPRVNDDKSKFYNLKPVMVYIHGGGFYGGSNSTKKASPEYLLREDVVMVSINYRLGLLA